MRITTEQSLPYFQFWSGAKDNAKMLTYDELENLEDALNDLYPDGIDETTLNDIMWFDFEFVCELLGLHYDIENDEIIREEEDTE